VPDDFYTFALTGSSAAGDAVPFSARVQFGKPDVPTSPPVDPVYYTSGYRTSGGAKWYTRCDYPSLQVLRCSVLKYAPFWARKGGTYVSAWGWIAYTTSYTSYDDLASWQTGIMSVPGRYSSGGYLWLTQCVPDAKTGPRTCWSYRWEPTVVRVSGTGSASTFAVQSHWRFKALVSLSARPAPTP
jgi:hypothetical protein